MIKSVVLLKCTERIPDWCAPWKSGTYKRSTCSGFAVNVKSQQMILTNAHCMQYSEFVECISGSNVSITMSIYDIAQELDLALLIPNNNEKKFWQSCTFPTISAQDVEQGENVIVVGFPRGGINSSMTRGIVSRYTMQQYSGAVNNMAVQIDAAVNPGNSGGPVFNEAGHVVGVAFAHQADMQNMCFMIPATFVSFYLREIEKHGSFPGLCDLSIHSNPVENQNMRDFLMFNNKIEGGIYIREVCRFGSSASILRSGDVIYKINNQTISERGMVKHSDNWIYFWQILREISVGDFVQLEILRNKEKLKLKIKLHPLVRYLIPTLDKDINKKYYIFGGLAFIALNTKYLTQKKLQDQSCDFSQYLEQWPNCENEEVIILSEIFASEINMGYNNPGTRLLCVNSEPVSSMRDLFDICEKPQMHFIKFEFEKEYIIVLDWAKALEVSDPIAQQHTGSKYHNF